MRVCLVGPSQSGKTSLFSAIVEAGGSSVDTSRPDQPHLAVVKVPDERLDVLADHFKPKKLTPAELEFLDLPGFDLSSPAGRERAKAHWPAMRQADMLVLVVRGFDDDTIAAYRGRVDPAGDVGELRNELLFADLEQVTARVEKLDASVRKPTPRQAEQKQELEVMKRLAEALENEQPIRSAIRNDAEDKLIRSFGFLSQKPALVVVNCDEEQASAENPPEVESLPAVYLSAAIEQEIAQLDPGERGEFLAEMNLAEPAADRMVQACYNRLDLISFLTVGEDECRAWTIPSALPAVEAAGKIHSDIQRGFIRAEVVSYDDFTAAGDMKSARAAGTVRLEGKEYPVADGDIINFRFNV
jgi:ribosome-binding ATPase